MEHNLHPQDFIKKYGQESFDVAKNFGLVFLSFSQIENVEIANKSAHALTEIMAKLPEKLRISSMKCIGEMLPAIKTSAVIRKAKGDSNVKNG